MGLFLLRESTKAKKLPSSFLSLTNECMFLHIETMQEACSGQGVYILLCIARQHESTETISSAVFCLLFHQTILKQ